MARTIHHLRLPPAGAVDRAGVTQRRGFCQQVSHCFERMTNWTFHNFDVCPRCSAAILQYRCSIVSTKLVQGYIHSFIVPTRAVKVSFKRNNFHAIFIRHDIVTGCRRKEEARDIGRLVNTMHLEPALSTSHPRLGSVVSSSELFT